MSDAIIVALITAAATVVCQIIITRKARHDADIKGAVERQKVNDRLDAIEYKLDVHNGYAEKLGDIQRDVAVLAAKMETKT